MFRSKIIKLIPDCLSINTILVFSAISKQKRLRLAGLNEMKKIVKIL